MSDLVTILDRLVAFDTVSAKPNIDMIDFIEATCRDMGAVCHRIKGTSDHKAGLLARFGPEEPGGIILSGHCDVVPVTGQIWSRPAFALTREGDRLFGRGTTDMKGFLSCMLDAAKTASGAPLKKPLTLVFSYDEEVGCVGIQEMKEKLPPLLGTPRLCIVGEPTNMKVAIGHKGKAALRAQITGQSGHSALAPNFVNALHIATDFINGLRELQTWYAQHGAQDAAYDIPYSTLHVGRLQGGTALNIVPDAAELIFEYRYLHADGDDALFGKIRRLGRDVASRYQSQCAQADLFIERYNAYPGLDASESSDAAQFAQELSGGADLTKVAFGTEAGVFADLGIPTIVCGPGSMSGQGHKPDEYIEHGQLQACKAMLERVIQTLQ